jgi:hypothetical protein
MISSVVGILTKNSFLYLYIDVYYSYWVKVIKARGTAALYFEPETPWRSEHTSVEKLGDDLCGGLKVSSNVAHLLEIWWWWRGFEYSFVGASFLLLLGLSRAFRWFGASTSARVCFCGRMGRRRCHGSNPRGYCCGL